MFLFQNEGLLTSSSAKKESKAPLKTQIDASIAGKRKGFAGEPVLDRGLASKIMLDIYPGIEKFSKTLAGKILPYLNDDGVLPNLVKDVSPTSKKDEYFANVAIPVPGARTGTMKLEEYSISFRISPKQEVHVTGIQGPYPEK